MPSERSVDSLSLAEAQALVLQDAELRQCLVDIARRQAGGASKGGRYNKHDTARLRFIRDTALKGLRLGMLVPDEDIRMIRHTAAADAGAREARQRSRQSGHGCMGRAAWEERRLEERFSRGASRGHPVEAAASCTSAGCRASGWPLEAPREELAVSNLVKGVYLL